MTRRPLPARGVAAALAAAAALVAPMAPMAHATTARTFKVVLLVPADDARLTRARLERAVLGAATGAAADAVRLGLDDARLELEAAGAATELAVVPVADAVAAHRAAADAQRRGAHAVLTDLPAVPTLVAARATALPVLNLSAGEDHLRGANCRANLWHVALSERQRADALAQTLVARKWTQVLMLVGPTDDDLRRAHVSAESVKRHGLKLVGMRPFKLSADPRERDLANPALLTGPAAGAYDAVWVVDGDGEFAQSLPYRTALPRPVVGDGGLVPVAWSSRFDRFGAPQVTRRLAKAAGRRMEAQDWLSWMAGKAVAQAALAATDATPQAFASALGALRLDGSKGVEMAFRPWDGQLRQTVLLTDGQAVVASAPIDGILHPTNALDTLGADAPEQACKARRP